MQESFKLMGKKLTEQLVPPGLVKLNSKVFINRHPKFSCDMCFCLDLRNLLQSEPTGVYYFTLTLYNCMLRVNVV